MIDHLSASQINLYIQCSLKYQYQCIDRIPKPFKASWLVFGGAVHSALDWFHKESIKGNKVSLVNLYKIFEADWYAQKLDNRIHYKNGENEMSLLLAGREMLGLYFKSPHKEIKGAEVPFHVPLVNLSTGEELGVQLDGFIDLIAEEDTIVEFKTSGQTMDQDSINHNLQMTAYSYVYRVLFDRDPKRLKLTNFVKTKTPKMVVHETARGVKDYERFFYIAEEVLKGIESGLFFPRYSFMCKDCEYEDICKYWKGNCGH